MDDLSTKATAIVRGRVLSSYAALQGSTVYTHYKVEVLERWKGTQSGYADVMLPGGSTSKLRQSFAGIPQLQEGKQYVMFLWAGKSGNLQLLGLTQGLFDLTTDATGQALASRPVSSELMLDSTGKIVRDQAVRISLREMSTRVGAAQSKQVVTK